MRILSESKVLSFVSCVNQGNERGKCVQNCVAPGVWKLPHSLEVAQFSACGVLVDLQANDGQFLPCWKLILLWVMGVGFENTCSVSGKWNVSGLFQDFMDGYIKF